VRRFDHLEEHTSHLPVVDHEHRLTGVVSLRELLVNLDDRVVGAVMHRKPRAIRADLDREDVAREFARHDFQMMPVVDERDRVIGVVTVDDVIDIIREEQTEDVQRTVGAGKGEAVYSTVPQKFRGRFPWLAVSVAMMIPSALVVRRFEGLIDELAILAVLMPVVAAVTGNAGHQALAVTLRGIVLGEVRPGRVLPLIRRETVAGLCNGLAIGLVLALGVTGFALIDPGVSWRVGVVAGVAISGSIIAGTAAGTVIPLLMGRLGFDPAQSAAILLGMITDAAAFAAFLGLAWALSSWLGVEAASATTAAVAAAASGDGGASTTILPGALVGG
jgi:magnesium transporter